MTPSILSVQVGTPTTRGTEDAPDPMDRLWTSAFYKEPVVGPLWLGRTGLAGDGQADTKHHGGPDKAMLGYAAAHYPMWRAELRRTDAAFGAFGENITIGDLTESTVCIGDVYRVGQVEVEVTQPRVPCWKMARRWRVRDMVARATQSGRTGWYFRVLTEGYIGAGLPLLLVERPYPQWTIAAAHSVMHFRHDDMAATAALAACPALAASWRETLEARIAKGAGEPV